MLPYNLAQSGIKHNVKFKNEVWWMRLLGVLLKPICPAFMTSYWTTIGTTVYAPNIAMFYKISQIPVYAHELVHVYDWHRLGGVKFVLCYLFPQWLSIFSLFSLFAFINSWFLLFLVFLLALAPWPSFGRSKLEVRGYAFQIMIDNISYGVKIENLGKILVSIKKAAKVYSRHAFTSPAYYFMSWSNKTDAIVSQYCDFVQSLQKYHKTGSASNALDEIALLCGSPQLPF